MKVIGKMTCSMAQESKFTVMVISMKECLSKEDEMARGRTTMPLEKFIKEGGSMAGSKDSVFVRGRTVKNMKGNGSITRNMDRESTAGPTAEGMREIIEMIKNMVMEHILGQTEGSILVNGKMIKGMDEAHMLSIVSYRSRAYGKRTRE
jgi:hypothetical protein